MPVTKEKEDKRKWALEWAREKNGASSIEEIIRIADKVVEYLEKDV